MPLRTLLLFVLACTDDPYDFSGSGGGDDSGGEADADTDSDTDVSPIDFDYDELTDVIAYDTPMTVLATNATYDSLDVIDLGTRSMKARIKLGDTPQRVKWDQANGLAYVVYGVADENHVPCASEIGCDNRVDIVDLAKESIETITLTVGKARYITTDVALGRDGGFFALGDGDTWWSQESVIEVDAKRALTVWPLQEDSEVNGVPFWYDGTSIYAEIWRFTFGTDPKKKTPLLVEANNYSPNDYSDWNGTPTHTALASDGTGILFPGKTKTVVELDPIKDGAWHEYELHPDTYSADDMAYTHDETRVVTVARDYDTYRLQVFDRASEKELRSTDVGGVGTIAADTEILVVGSDDAYAWVYVYAEGYNNDEGRFLVTPLEL